MPHENPSSVRSKKMLTEALLALMREEGYESITITQLCGKSGLSRSAFYSNFKSKEDVLSYYFDALRPVLRDVMPESRMDFEEKVRHCFCAVEEDKSGLRALLDDRSLYVKAAVADFMAEAIHVTNPFAGSLPGEVNGIMEAAVSGAVAGVLAYWVRNDFTPDAAALAHVFSKVLEGAEHMET